MNLLTVIVIIIIALCVLRGYREGLAKGLASIISLMVSLVLVSFLSPQVTVFLEENTPVYEYVLDKCEQTFSISGTGASKEERTEKETTRQAADGVINITEADGTPESEPSVDTGNDMANALTEAAKSVAISSTDARKLLEDLKLPEIVQNMLLENNTPEQYVELAAASFYEYVPKFMANLVMNVISFLVTWILVLLILRIVMALFGMVNHIPIVGGINRLLGGCLGLVEAIFIVWILFLLITAFSSTAVCKQLLDMIEESAFLKELYNANLLMEFLQNVVGKFAV